MAVAEKNILDRAGKYNLSELNIISYQQVDNEPRFIDIKGITLPYLFQRIYFLIILWAVLLCMIHKILEHYYLSQV